MLLTGAAAPGLSISFRASAGPSFPCLPLPHQLPSPREPGQQAGTLWHLQPFWLLVWQLHISCAPSRLTPTLVFGVLGKSLVLWAPWSLESRSVVRMGKGAGEGQWGRLRPWGAPSHWGDLFCPALDSQAGPPSLLVGRAYREIQAP